MSLQLNPPKEQIADFEAVIAIPVESLEKMVPSTTGGGLMRPQELEAAFAAFVDLENAKKLTRALLSLRSLAGHLDIDVEVCLRGVRDGLARMGWGEQSLADFDLRSELFAAMLVGANVRRVSQGLSVAYEYENFFQSARIITDIRPIFDKDAKVIEGTLITHTLRLRYDSEATEHAISVAMDLADIKKLHFQCERAISKAQVACDFMNQRAEVTSVIAGDLVEP